MPDHHTQQFGDGIADRLQADDLVMVQTGHPGNYSDISTDGQVRARNSPFPGGQRMTGKQQLRSYSQLKTAPEGAVILFA